MRVLVPVPTQNINLHGRHMAIASVKTTVIWYKYYDTTTVVHEGQLACCVGCCCVVAGPVAGLRGLPCCCVDHFECISLFLIVLWRRELPTLLSSLGHVFQSWTTCSGGARPGSGCMRAPATAAAKAVRRWPAPTASWPPPAAAPRRAQMRARSRAPAVPAASQSGRCT